MASTKRGDLWMPLYITDYFGDTAHLTTAQHGAYLLLLMTAWRRGGSLPDDDVQLAQIVRCDAKTWRGMRPVLVEFFDIDDGAWMQKRLTAELAKAGGIVDKRRAAGKAGAAKRWAEGSKDGDKPIANAMANGMANGQHDPWQIDAPSQSPTPKPTPPDAARIGASTTSPPEEPDRAAPLPADPPPTDDPPATRRGAVAGVLRGLGVACTYAHPTVCEWASKGVTDAQLREAVEVARMRKPAPESIPIAYLAPIVRELHERPVDAGGSRERDWAYIFGETDRRAVS